MEGVRNAGTYGPCSIASACRSASTDAASTPASVVRQKLAAIPETIAVANDVPDHHAQPVSLGRPAGNEPAYMPSTPSSGSRPSPTLPPKVATWSPSSRSSPIFEYGAG